MLPLFPSPRIINLLRIVRYLTETTPLMNRTDSITINYDQSPQPRTFRERLGEFLESPRFQYFIIGLIICDVIILVVELTVEKEEQGKKNAHSISNSILNGIDMEHHPSSIIQPPLFKYHIFAFV